MGVRADGLPSRTRWRAVRCAGDYTLVECWPETGRQHQIRAHLDHLGFPIVGDKLYPDERVFADYQDHGWAAVADKLALPRQALHAAELRFVHPTTGVEVVIEAPLPADLAVVMTEHETTLDRGDAAGGLRARAGDDDDGTDEREARDG